MIYGVIGFVIGFIFTLYLVCKFYLNGEMVVDYNDPTKDIYKLCIRDFNKLDKAKFLLVKIEKK